MTVPPISDDRSRKYATILLEPLRKCADYLPKMGGQANVDRATFTTTYREDPLYHWIGFDSPLMFTAHKAAGGMTSIYRQLGIGCERLIRQILMDELSLTSEQVKWSYEMVAKGKTKKLTLDGRMEMEDIRDTAARQRIDDWINSQRRSLSISVELKGAVFEVRQGYKSADSKRQNADLANAAQALGDGYLPVLAIMSTQINHVVRARYQTGNWAVLLGSPNLNDPSRSTFDFVHQVIGYDLAGFFQSNTDALRTEVEGILKALLEAK